MGLKILSFFFFFFTFLLLMCFIIIIINIHLSNTSTYCPTHLHIVDVLDECMYVYVLEKCIYFMIIMKHIGTSKVKFIASQARTVNLCRCVGRMYIFYDNLKILAHTWVPTLDCPPHRELLDWLHYPGCLTRIHMVSKIVLIQILITARFVFG
jgi:hypothetical protein